MRGVDATSWCIGALMWERFLEWDNGKHWRKERGEAGSDSETVLVASRCSNTRSTSALIESSELRSHGAWNLTTVTAVASDAWRSSSREGSESGLNARRGGAWRRRAEGVLGQEPSGPRRPQWISTVVSIVGPSALIRPHHKATMQSHATA